MKASNFTRQAKTALPLVAALVLAACGGGGGSAAVTSPSPAPTPVPAPAPAAVLQTTVPAPVYSDPEVAAAFNFLNDERAKCGLGKLAQSYQLDASAANHIAYISRNGLNLTHIETMGLPGFTGVYPSDRAYAAGVATTEQVSETIGGSSSPVASMARLLGAPYHAATALSPHKTVGMSAVAQGTAGGSYIFNVNYSYDTQQSAGPVLATYPCAGTEIKVRNFYQEAPNPLRTFGDPNANGSAGHAIMIQSKPGSALEVTEVTITRAGSAISTRGVLTSTNDANSSLQANQAAAIPVWEALVNGGTYDVNIQAKIDGVPVSKSFSFSVAADAARN